ncbi:ADP ribosylation factor family Ras of Complex Roc domain [Trypanosoma vivax]|uniref:Putative small GTP-binding protein n=1 Tax=Trypanosoma vivax (strain Y486) TaxID=1055687 RepID=G0TTP4_TRYVY|nr:putative small GTP-binding protein [Trypanosoma vivax]KAH8606856.1 ADP ribosylation factor family Ras of Complex Roc domain [Trypanosoma vivax]CCC47325.1 putative small GTP-binding protein [Trypanosoma vivax Y486]
MVYLRLQVCVVGAPTVGKTAYVQMLHSNGVTFPKNYLMTLGCDFVVKEVQLDEENTVEMLIYDVAGQKEYETLVPTLLTQAAVAILMYDISNKLTFENCSRWITMLRSMNKDIIGILIANKSDLSDKAEVTDRQGKELAQANQMKFYKVSTLRGLGIHEPIEEIARLYLAAYNRRVEQLTQMS